MKPILEIKGISKKFQINSSVQPYLSLRDSITSFLKPSLKKEEFWALKDISFDVMPGDTIGIIGKNGAGKSTLLKILSKITPPTSGKIIGRGRIASLLEVGTGFHPELSGRENVFMNGSILGMRRAEILKNFDAIVDFSGVEKFIDTPLKHYSSGMQLRLAFAVAAFLEPEILIIDEVLAVGDTDFQKKCIQKMNDVSLSGRTILFVSHNILQLQSLCKKGVLLQAGRCIGYNSIEKIISEYTNDKTASNYIFIRNKKQTENLEVVILKSELISISKKQSNEFFTHEEFYVEIIWENKTGKKIMPNLEFKNSNGHVVLVSVDSTIDWDGSKKSERGTYKSSVKIPANLLNESIYSISIALNSATPNICYDYLNDILTLKINDAFNEFSIARGALQIQRPDVGCWMALEWTFEKTN